MEYTREDAIRDRDEQHALVMEARQLFRRCHYIIDNEFGNLRQNDLDAIQSWLDRTKVEGLDDLCA